MEVRTYSRVFRVIHWLIAFCIMGLLLTIFLRLNWMNKQHMADILLSQLGEMGYDVQEEDAIKAAKAIRKPMWQWHIWLGYAMIGLYVVRMILGFFGPMPFMNPLKKGLTTMDKFRAWLYILFYLALAYILTTGFLVVNGGDAIHELMEELHEKSLIFVMSFVIIHISGVLLAELGGQKGIISRIISGDKR